MSHKQYFICFEIIFYIDTFFQTRTSSIRKKLRVITPYFIFVDKRIIVVKVPVNSKLLNSSSNFILFTSPFDIVQTPIVYSLVAIRSNKSSIFQPKPNQDAQFPIIGTSPARAPRSRQPHLVSSHPSAGISGLFESPDPPLSGTVTSALGTRGRLQKWPLADERFCRIFCQHGNINRR